jgi:hypothetical protein
VDGARTDRGPAAAPRSGAAASDAIEALARELYWVGGATTRIAADAGSLRERLQTFAHRLRVDAMELYPSSEMGLEPSPRIRRRFKRVLWHLGRFATLRYDRMLAELAELNAQLAERLAETERELERLRAERGDRDA